MTPITLILPFSVTLGVLASGLIALWYIWPHLRNAPLRQALIPLILPHAFRFVGLTFLIHGVTTSALDPRFAYPSAFGDAFTAILAIITSIALRSDSKFGIPLAWIFSIVGIVDFINAFVGGLTMAEPGDLGAAYLIPMVFVPPLIASHIMVVTLLLKKRNSI